jgi:hypothetical protein
MDRWYKAYTDPGYEWKAGSKPRIWLTATGAGYTYGCAGLSEGREALRCGGNIPEDDRDKVLRVGMARQRNAMAFLMRKIAGKYSRISRIYFYNLRNAAGLAYPQFGPNASSGNCRPTPRTNAPWCDRDDYGLVGSDHDGQFPYYRTMPNSSGFSNPGQRRWAFCLMSDTGNRVRNVQRPKRISKCP